MPAGTCSRVLILASASFNRLFSFLFFFSSFFSRSSIVCWKKIESMGIAERRTQKCVQVSGVCACVCVHIYIYIYIYIYACVLVWLSLFLCFFSDCLFQTVSMRKCTSAFLVFFLEKLCSWWWVVYRIPNPKHMPKYTKAKVLHTEDKHPSAEQLCRALLLPYKKHCWC